MAENNHDWLKHTTPYFYLAQVKTHLANHYPMSLGDARAWEIADQAQQQCQREELSGMEDAAHA